MTTTCCDDLFAVSISRLLCDVLDKPFTVFGILSQKVFVEKTNHELQKHSPSLLLSNQILDLNNETRIYLTTIGGLRW